MGLTWAIICRRTTDLAFMVSHATFPATTVYVTHRTTLDIDVGAGGEVLCSKEVIDSTTCTGCINILRDRTTKQGDVSSAIDITTQRLFCLSPATAVGIVHNGSTFMDDNVGIEFMVYPSPYFVRESAQITIIYLSCSYQCCIAEVDVFVGSISYIFSLRIIVATQCPCSFPIILPCWLPFFLQVTRSHNTRPSLRFAPVRIIC